MAQKILDHSDSTQTSEQRIVRKRFGGPRSKSGCITCRIRHVKCDETKPACSRCTKTGRKCDGYQKQPWDVVDVSSMANLLTLSSDPRATTNHHAGRSFKFFERLTAGYLGGLFESTLWQEVLRASHHNDAMWYAATALGSAHEAYLHRRFDMQSSEEDWAMQQYNRAIRSLTKPDALGEQPPHDVIMAASILFMAFEMLRREYGKAINHLRSGIGIFGEYNSREVNKDSRRPQSPSSNMISMEHLEHVLRQLETHLCELCMECFPGPIMPRRSLVGQKALPSDDATQPHPAVGFDGILEARLEIDGYWHNLMFFLHGLAEPDVFATTLPPEDFIKHCLVFQQMFSTWRSNFDVLVQTLHDRPEPLTSIERKATAQLELCHLAAAQIISTCLSHPNEMVWDNFQPGFDRMMDLCDIIVGSSSRSDNTENTDSKEPEYCGFQLDQGIVAACFHAAWKCRSARLRQRALKLLAQQRQEGLWDAHLVARVAQQIDEIERGPDTLDAATLRDAGAEEIPCWKRVMGVDIMFSSEGRHAVISFMKQRSEHDDSLINIRRVLNW